MWRFDRYTARRGRAAGPEILRRIRSPRRARAERLSSPRWSVLMSSRPSPPCPPSSGRTPPRTGCPCPCTARGFGSPGDPACGCGGLELDAVWARDGDRVGVSDGDLQVLAPEGCPVPDANDLQSLLVALRYSVDHVRDECARQPVKAPVEALVARALDPDDAVVANDAHLGVEPPGKCSPRALHRHGRVLVDGHLDAVRDLDGLLSDPTHGFVLTPRRPGPRRRCRGERPPGPC